MQKSLLIGFIILIAQTAFAQKFNPIDQTNKTILHIQPQVGYSLSKTTFNIAGNELGQNPNVLSELIWDPTNSIEYGIDLKLKRNKFVFNTQILMNKTLSGSVTDFDYDGDNRTSPTSKLYLSNHNGSGHTLKIQPGYNWSTAEHISFVTYLSFDHSAKTLYLLNHKDWRSNDRNYISGLNSYYKYKFPNYGLGAQIDYSFDNRWSTHVGIEGYISKYYAYGNWNLISDFEKPISYEHKGNGKKVNFNMGVDYAISPNISIEVKYNLNHFNVVNGKDYLHHIHDGLLKARLNDANETKHTILVGLSYNLPLTK